jgi:hypothetical protein
MRPPLRRTEDVDVPADLGSERLHADAGLPAPQALEDVDQRLEALFFQLDANAAALVAGRAEFGVEACEVVDQRQTDALIRNLDDDRVTPSAD